MTPPNSLVLEAPRDAQSLATLRAAVAAFARGAGLAEEAAGEVTLAVGEACANAVEHARSGDPAGGRLKLRLATGEGELRVTVEHYCRTGDIPRIRGRDLGDVRPGGLGVHCMEKLMDRLEFEAEPDGWAAVRLVRRLPGAGRPREEKPA
ncbi:MAG: ATP-binding protein [Planctomycetales bacterium]|nr:ATP-binding protein [Planctomycetales bacterium]